MKFKKTIGILGGMGPSASAYIYQQIIYLAQKKYHAVQDTDYPEIIIYNMPLYGFDETGIVDKEKVLAQLIAGVKKLEQAGADFVVVACNTIHLFQEEMQAAINIPFVSMIDEVVKSVKKKECKKIGLLGSETTNDTGLYQKAFEKESIEIINSSDRQQKKITKIILHVMGGSQNLEDKKVLIEIINDLKEQGAEVIVLGCTELPLVITEEEGVENIVDAMYVISKKALDKSLE